MKAIVEVKGVGQMGVGSELILERYRQPRRCTKRPPDLVSGSPGSNAFFATGESVLLRDRQVQGLALPETVLRKIFRENVVRCLPEILA